VFRRTIHSEPDKLCRLPDRVLRTPSPHWCVLDVRRWFSYGCFEIRHNLHALQPRRLRQRCVCQLLGVRVGPIQWVRCVLLHILCKGQDGGRKRSFRLRYVPVGNVQQCRRFELRVVRSRNVEFCRVDDLFQLCKGVRGFDDRLCAVRCV